MTGSHHIRIVVYSSKTGVHLERIKNDVVGCLPEGTTVDILDSTGKLALSLSGLLMGDTIFLILVHSHAELGNVIKLKRRLNAFNSTVLVLPDTERETVSTGLQLYPRYISYLKEDYNDVYCVLTKMITNIKQMY